MYKIPDEFTIHPGYILDPFGIHLGGTCDPIGIRLDSIWDPRWMETRRIPHGSQTNFRWVLIPGGIQRDLLMDPRQDPR